MILRRFVQLAAFLALPLVLLADIGMGDSRDAVLNAHGRPTSVLRREGHEIFLYPKGGRVEFVEGKVVDVKGPLPPAPETPVVPVAPSEPPAAAAAPPATVPAPAAATPALAEKPAVPPAAPRAVAPRPAPVGRDEDEDHGGPSIGVAIATLAVTLLLQFGLTFAALKIAFHYHQMDALWSGILAIASIDVGLQMVMAIVRYFQSGELLLGPAGTGLPGLAMIFTLRKFCLDQRWGRAVATTSAVKIASVLLTLGLLSLTHKFLD